MVKAPREKAGPGPIRALNLPAPVEVEEDDRHRPTSMALRGRRLHVASVEEVWEVVEEWWRTDPIARRYFRVIVSDGSSATVFRDLKSGLWYEQRA